MKKNEWNDFINEQLDMKCKLINEISTELLNLENLNYDLNQYRVLHKKK